MFKVGEYVIYRRDLCLIDSIIDNKYYKLSLIDDDSLSINIPIENKQGFLRYPISVSTAKELIKKIPNIEPIKTNDKFLENAYKELMRTNKHEDLIKIIKTTYLRNKEREKKEKKLQIKIKYFLNKLKNIYIMN